MEKKYIGIIILNYNNSSDTKNCFRSIIENNTIPVKFIVVDNGSTDDSVLSLHTYFDKVCNNLNYIKISYERDCNIKNLPDVSLIVSKNNDGYAKGNNKGLQYAYADESIDNILIINNDILFVEDILPEMVNKLDSIPNCGIICPILYKRDLKSIDYNCARRNVTISQLINKNLFYYIYKIGHIKYNNNRFLLKTDSWEQSLLPIELPSGSCMLISKNLLKMIGGFDPNTFLYYEENIMFVKIRKVGKQNYLLRSKRCIHLGASSTKKSSSLFIMKEAMKSEAYYVKMYSGASSLQYLLYMFSNIFFLFSFRLQKFLGITIK